MPMQWDPNRWVLSECAAMAAGLDQKAYRTHERAALQAQRDQWQRAAAWDKDPKQSS